MFTKTLTLALLALGAVASPIEAGVEVEKRACPGVHVFGARETTASPGKDFHFTYATILHAPKLLELIPL